MISIISLTAYVYIGSFSLSLPLLFYSLFSRTTSSVGRMMMMMIVALRVCVSHLKRKWQHSPTLSWRYCTIQKCLLQKSPPLCIHPFLPLCPSSSISVLYVAISERLLLLLLMGDVNHRCANNTEKHVHNTTRARESAEDERKRRVVAVVVFFNVLIVGHTHTHTRTSRVMHVHFTLCLFLCLICCCICVISTSWYPSSTDDDERRARRKCLWMHARSNLEWWKESEK